MPGSIRFAEEAVLPFAHSEIAQVERGRLGPALRAAREGRRMRLEDVQAETRIGLKYLAAIEESRFDEFSSHIYARGFVRAYARAVGIGEQWAVDTLRAELGERPVGWRRTGWVG
jgi:cytoskeletal protein RodZ